LLKRFLRGVDISLLLDIDPDPLHSVAELLLRLLTKRGFVIEPEDPHIFEASDFRDDLLRSSQSVLRQSMRVFPTARFVRNLECLEFGRQGEVVGEALTLDLRPATKQ
jgi:hypothetical protein